MDGHLEHRSIVGFARAELTGNEDDTRRYGQKLEGAKKEGKNLQCRGGDHKIAYAFRSMQTPSDVAAIRQSAERHSV